VRWRTLLGGIIAVGVVMLASGCTGAGLAPTPTPIPTFDHTGDGILRIGSLFPVKGTTKFIGAAQVAGVELAVREINKAGGVLGAPVQVFHRDSGDVTTQTLEASLKDLIAKKVDVVIGPSSSALVQRALDPALAAKIPLITPAATFPISTTATNSKYLFRTIGKYADQGIALSKVLTEKGPATVALIHSVSDLSATLLASLKKAMKAKKGSHVTDLPLDATVTDFESLIAQIVAAKPTAVVVATTAETTDQTKALIKALKKADLAGSMLWLTSQNTADYSRSLPKRTLDGANAILEGATPDTLFLTRLKQIDPGVHDFRYAEEAYDATILAALAATVVKDDGGPAIARTLRSVSVGGIKCTSYGECLDTLKTQTDIDYDGISSSLNFTKSGEVSAGSFGIYLYGSKNTYTFVKTVTSN
jgi:branched-chain amino acid transport system substrate-binding protein